MRSKRDKKEDIEKTDEENMMEEKSEIESENEDEIYAVEKILGHRLNMKRTGWEYLIKWKGYDKDEDNTWEDEKSCEGCKDLINQYWESIGGRLVPSEKPTARKRKSSQLRKNENNESDIKHRASTSRSKEISTSDLSSENWKPPMHLSSWEDEIESVDTIERDASGKLLVYVNWVHGKKSVHDSLLIYQKCPLKMLHFYENHLVFRDVA
ncbi:hypothetical protein MERGE_001413 [Pneumocystis wakefieldiae]|uniref:Chromo domain-containing protein n=1 Tax=Pneumocystis wakefieldiae TaxID=38082 RepID=A0A899G273_9ASCO|nr:hypothetical protein MERGE_001413 [Pneumocystis wakefieldiae]